MVLELDFDDLPPAPERVPVSLIERWGLSRQESRPLTADERSELGAGQAFYRRWRFVRNPIIAVPASLGLTILVALANTHNAEAQVAALPLEGLVADAIGAALLAFLLIPVIVALVLTVYLVARERRGSRRIAASVHLLLSGLGIYTTLFTNGPGVLFIYVVCANFFAGGAFIGTRFIASRNLGPRYRALPGDFAANEVWVFEGKPDPAMQNRFDPAGAPLRRLLRDFELPRDTEHLRLEMAPYSGFVLRINDRPAKLSFGRHTAIY